MKQIVTILLFFIGVTGSATAHQYDITEFGATPGDGSDDTTAIGNALTACGNAGGGTVFVPAGTFIVSRRNNETPILEVPSDTTLCGAGTASILKFAVDVNQSNFWRMIGAPVDGGAKNIVIRDIHPTFRTSRR
jgi:hypothetical protein